MFQNEDWSKWKLNLLFEKFCSWKIFFNLNLQYHWRIGANGHYPDYPIEITRMWSGLPKNLTHVDAVYERPDRKIAIFVGTRIIRSTIYFFINYCYRFRFDIQKNECNWIFIFFNNESNKIIQTLKQRKIDFHLNVLPKQPSIFRYIEVLWPIPYTIYISDVYKPIPLFEIFYF